jgi:hypothetical protein
MLQKRKQAPNCGSNEEEEEEEEETKLRHKGNIVQILVICTVLYAS